MEMYQHTRAIKTHGSPSWYPTLETACGCTCRRLRAKWPNRNISYSKTSNINVVAVLANNNTIVAVLANHYKYRKYPATSYRRDGITGCETQDSTPPTVPNSQSHCRGPCPQEKCQGCSVGERWLRLEYAEHPVVGAANTQDKRRTLRQCPLDGLVGVATTTRALYNRRCHGSHSKRASGGEKWIFCVWIVTSHPPTQYIIYININISNNTKAKPQ
jgi:hypothetical protein